MNPGSMRSPEEETIESEKLNEYIKTELSFDFVNEKDESDMISFLANIGFGKLLAKTTYSFDRLCLGRGERVSHRARGARERALY